MDLPNGATTTTGAAAPVPPLRRRPAGSASLDAAGITDPQLRADLLECRRLHAEHGKTYFLATALLPPAKRPWVWALYGFARYADEFVDSLTDPDPDALVSWSDGFLASLDGREEPTEPVGRAMLATVRRWDLPLDTVTAFLDSMRADITTTHYPTYADLQDYMYGSANVIGLQMLPVLQPLPGAEAEAAHRAELLGEAFQVSNFIRDVGEDLDRGRTYLPDEHLEAFGVTRELLEAGRSAGPDAPLDRRVEELLRFEVAENRKVYREAEPGIALLHPTSRDSIRCAFELYGGILGAVEDADYKVLAQRVSVPLPRRLAVALPALARARAARREMARWKALPHP